MTCNEATAKAQRQRALRTKKHREQRKCGGLFHRKHPAFTQYHGHVRCCCCGYTTWNCVEWKVVKRA